jgi:hypothetical protein
MRGLRLASPFPRQKAFGTDRAGLPLPGTVRNTLPPGLALLPRKTCLSTVTTGRDRKATYLVSSKVSRLNFEEERCDPEVL